MNVLLNPFIFHWSWLEKGKSVTTLVLYHQFSLLPKKLENRCYPISMNNDLVIFFYLFIYLCNLFQLSINQIPSLDRVRIHFIYLWYILFLLECLIFSEWYPNPSHRILRNLNPMASHVFVVKRSRIKREIE